MPAPLQVSPGVQSLVSTPATRWLPCNLTIPCLGSIPFPCAHWFPPAACLLTPQSPHPQARSFPWPVTRAQLHYSPQCLSQFPKPSLATQPIPLSTDRSPARGQFTHPPPGLCSCHSYIRLSLPLCMNPGANLPLPSRPSCIPSPSPGQSQRPSPPGTTQQAGPRGQSQVQSPSHVPARGRHEPQDHCTPVGCDAQQVGRTAPWRLPSQCVQQDSSTHPFLPGWPRTHVDTA